MNEYRRPVWAEIDLDAIGANVRTLCDLVQSPAQFMAVVKADGYGHGAIHAGQVAVANGAHRLGVALLEEAVQLRGAGIDVPIHIFSEVPAQAAQDVVEYDLIPTVFSNILPQALSAAAEAADKKVKVHVKVDTGMCRVGLAPGETLDFLKRCGGLPGLDVEGIYTHFAMADTPDEPTSARQLGAFEQLLLDLDCEGMLPPIKHAANSAATILAPSSHLDMVRCGIAIYGLHPGEATKSKITLRPALSLKARVSFVKRVSAGAGISYGHTYRPKGETTIATLPLGYADGYSRMLSNKADVLVAGRRMPVAGTVCMDQLMVDAGPDSGVEVDDEAVLIGRSGKEQVTADELATRLGTINYEVTCMISKRVPRIYV